MRYSLPPLYFDALKVDVLYLHMYVIGVQPVHVLRFLQGVESNGVPDTFCVEVLRKRPLFTLVVVE